MIKYILRILTKTKLAVTPEGTNLLCDIYRWQNIHDKEWLDKNGGGLSEIVNG